MLIGDKTKQVSRTLVAACLLMGAWTAGGQVPDTLKKAFADPPMSARPRVWWHWINGNVTQEGIRKDLEWMQRSGIAGMQTFNLYSAMPQVVEQRLVYMTSAWKAAFRYSADLADKMGLELGIAASAGWSETGGPWVKPQDAMKKLVWSEAIIVGGARFNDVLPPPPTTTGPYQDLPAAPDLGNEHRQPDPDFYADVAVLGFRSPAPEPNTTPVIALADGTALDASLFSYGRSATGVDVPRGTLEKPTVIGLTCDQPRTIRSASLFIPSAVGTYSPATIMPRLEASSDGRNWRKITDFQLSLVPTVPLH